MRPEKLFFAARLKAFVAVLVSKTRSRGKKWRMKLKGSNCREKKRILFMSLARCILQGARRDEESSSSKWWIKTERLDSRNGIAWSSRQDWGPAAFDRQEKVEWAVKETWWHSAQAGKLKECLWPTKCLWTLVGTVWNISCPWLRYVLGRLPVGASRRHRRRILQTTGFLPFSFYQTVFF